MEEDESFYEVQTEPGEPFVSYFPLKPNCETYNILHFLHHGSTVVHFDDDGYRSAVVFVRLERNNSTLTWCKPPWSIQKGNPCTEYNVGSNSYQLISPGFLLKYETSDVSHGSVEEGFLDLAAVKDVRMVAGDLGNVSKRYGIPDDVSKSSLRLLYGNSLSDNRCLEFMAPSRVMQQWHKGIDYAVSQLKKQKMLSDRRMYWLKEKYIHLYFEDLACAGPTPAEAIKASIYTYMHASIHIYQFFHYIFNFSKSAVLKLQSLTYTHFFNLIIIHFSPLH